GDNPTRPIIGSNVTVIADMGLKESDAADVTISYRLLYQLSLVLRRTVFKPVWN
ncbi:uncharacterized protein V6R79_000072, partial [Siganus canaliculatus]